MILDTEKVTTATLKLSQLLLPLYLQTIQYRDQVISLLCCLSNRSTDESLNIEELMRYPLTPAPYSLDELAELKEADYCIMVLGLYVFTGKDVTSTVR